MANGSVGRVANRLGLRNPRPQCSGHLTVRRLPGDDQGTPQGFHGRVGRGTSRPEDSRDTVNRVDPEGATFADANEGQCFRRIDRDRLAMSDTVERLRQWAPQPQDLR